MSSASCERALRWEARKPTAWARMTKERPRLPLVEANWTGKCWHCHVAVGPLHWALIVKHAKHAKSGKVFGHLWPIIGSKVVKGGKTSDGWAAISLSHRIEFSRADHCVSCVGESLWQVSKQASQRHKYIQMAMRIIARVTWPGATYKSLG